MTGVTKKMGKSKGEAGGRRETVTTDYRTRSVFKGKA